MAALLLLAFVLSLSAPTEPSIKLLSKEVFISHEQGRPVATGFITYIHAAKPILMHCYGRVQYSDGYDDYAVCISTDNGKTWSTPEVRWKSEPTPEGPIRYGEPAAFFDPDSGKLIVLADRALYPNNRLNIDRENTLVLDVFNTATGQWAPRRELSFPGQRSPAVSFSFPIKTRKGRILFPGMRKTLDENGKPRHYKGGWPTVDEVVTIIGEYRKDGDIAWRLGKGLRLPAEVSSRGLNENTLAELRDGRIAAICRGSNHAFPDKPGYKWLSFSSDDGDTWSPPRPLPATGGSPIESGSNGSALFRSIKNGKLYWIGNLALNGERANANWPRSPLVMTEVQEEPIALKRETIFVVDQRGPADSARLQLSNFRYYQDRPTGDVLIFLSRFGEKSEREWMRADYYRYRVGLPGRESSARIDLESANRGTPNDDIRKPLFD